MCLGECFQLQGRLTSCPSASGDRLVRLSRRSGENAVDELGIVEVNLIGVDSNNRTCISQIISLDVALYIGPCQLTVSLVHLLDLLEVLASQPDIVVDLIPVRQGYVASVSISQSTRVVLVPASFGPGIAARGEMATVTAQLDHPLNSGAAHSRR